MPKTPHKEKLLAAIANPKAAADVDILNEAYQAYQAWIQGLNALQSEGDQRLADMVALLNQYKDYVEVDLIMARGSDFLKRQKGQLKLDNSILEEFLIHLVNPAVLGEMPAFELETGPQTAFMSLAFRPTSVSNLDERPELVLKLKDQDFTIGRTIHYKFSPDQNFVPAKTKDGSLFLAVLAAECKVNYDKTMFQECAGTATRLKHGCLISKYFALVEYLDMKPEDVRLTDIDTVFLLRKAKRLPFEKRSRLEEVRAQHQAFPISAEVVGRFVAEIRSFVEATWYDPDEALQRGSFV
jgi:hypothetical protein